jgi:hypothetical protein
MTASKSQLLDAVRIATGRIYATVEESQIWRPNQPQYCRIKAVRCLANRRGVSADPSLSVNTLSKPPDTAG